MGRKNAREDAANKAKSNDKMLPNEMIRFAQFRIVTEKHLFY